MEILKLDAAVPEDARIVYAILVRGDDGVVKVHKTDEKALEIFGDVDAATGFLEKHPAPADHEVALQECLLKPSDGGYEILFQNMVLTVASVH